LIVFILGSTPQTQGADCNGSGVVPSEGEGHSKYTVCTVARD